MNVDIQPLPAWARGKKYRPSHPPIFVGGDPTAAEIELALALIHELDEESQNWYGGAAFVERLSKRLQSGHDGHE